IGETPTIVMTLFTATIGVICLAGAMIGYLFTRASILERIALLVAALALIKPGLWTDLAGLGLVLGVGVVQLGLRKTDKVAQASEHAAE
ncbi:MAG: DUF3394 domain-containing protein, partial [Pseudomonadota bacterium]